MIETEDDRVAKFMVDHHRYVMTGEGDAKRIVAEIRRLQRMGRLDAEEAAVLESAMKSSDAELRLQRIAAGESLDSVYDSPWRKFAHSVAWVIWFAAAGTAAEYLLGDYHPPKNIYLALLFGVVVMVALFAAATFAHRLTTGEIIDDWFE